MAQRGQPNGISYRALQRDQNKIERRGRRVEARQRHQPPPTATGGEVVLDGREEQRSSLLRRGGGVMGEWRYGGDGN
jgi:hypothetical protein